MIRFHPFVRKYAIVLVNPSASGTFGSYSRIFFAFMMPGLRQSGLKLKWPHEL